MGAQFTFPSGNHIKEIPLWINFCAIPYSKMKLKDQRRGDPRSHVFQASMTASVPFNGSFSNSNNLIYTDNAAVILQYMGSPTTTSTEHIRLGGLSQMMAIDGAGKVSVTIPPPTAPTAANMYMSVDMMDVMYLGGGRRGYQINFDMIARSAQDSLVAGKICAALSSQCWPLLNANTQPGTLGGNAKLMHPDIWVIYLSDIPGSISTAFKCDNSWNDGIGPQLCVLHNVVSTRVGGSNARLLGIHGPGDSDPKPMWYKVSLSFVELETSIQSPTHYEVINRSTALP